MIPQWVDDFIMHYASEYYDPVKAREYYLKNRELKGLSTAAPAPPKKVTAASKAAAVKRESNARQREAQSYSKNQIATKRTAEQTGQKNAQTARLATIQKNAEALKKRVSEKLNAVVEKVKADLAGVKLNDIPENAPPKVKLFLMKQNQSIMATAQGKAREELGAASEKANGELKKMGTDMRAAVGKARADYAKNKQAIAGKYKQISVREEQNIRTHVK